MGEGRGVEMLDLSTMRWSGGAVPALPEPRRDFAACSFADGRVVVVGGVEIDDGLRSMGDNDRKVMQWVPGATEWTRLPDLTEQRDGAAAVALLDGRAMVIGASRCRQRRR